MIDPHLIVAEMRAGELLTALQSAVDADAHWRSNARRLLRQIAACELPPQTTDALREVDARKRASEILEDLCSGAPTNAD